MDAVNNLLNNNDEQESEESQAKRIKTEEHNPIPLVLVCSRPGPIAQPAMQNVVQMLAGDVPRAKPSLSFNTIHLLSTFQHSVSDLNEQ
ncbi:hypothetical protein Tco_1078863 [Tanacetum coccineum]|uniref:Uncharacterized protein n=1 Tax=Tanacetum coccineum TaxID=301880 RepID=A0ABQ5HQ75_9ASTR